MFEFFIRNFFIFYFFKKPSAPAPTALESMKDNETVPAQRRTCPAEEQSMTVTPASPSPSLPSLPHSLPPSPSHPHSVNPSLCSCFRETAPLRCCGGYETTVSSWPIRCVAIPGGMEQRCTQFITSSCQGDR